VTDNVCVCCERPTDDGYACTHCGITRPTEQLATIVDMTPAARDVAHGQARHGSTGGGSGEPRLVLNLGATQRLDSVQTALTTWVRHIAAQRGSRTPITWHDPIAQSAEWLTGQLEWLRHRREVDDALADIAACARIVAGVARGPGERKYLGPCVAPTGPAPDRCPVDCECHHGPHYPCTEPGGCGSAGCGRPTGICSGNVYVRVLNTETGACAATGYCHRCGGPVATDERRAWLDGEVRQHAYRAAHIAEAYDISVDTIRSWAARGHLRSYWVTPAGITAEWTEPHLDPELEGDERAAREAAIAEELAQRGPRVHYVGDVLDLAAADAARRAGEQAKRARRAAARAAEEASVTT
jgi:hypothetical protein